LKTITISAGCFNEKGNVTQMYERFKSVFNDLPDYDFILQLIDNYSTDGTRQEIEELCSKDKRVRSIFNTRNFGHIRSPFYGFLQAEGDAIFTTVSDLQVEPEIIKDFIKKWENGADIVLGIKSKSQDTYALSIFRKLYYFLINKLSDVPQKRNFIGIGLYDKSAADAIKSLNDPYPYFRGMVFEVGFKTEEVVYEQKPRPRGITKNNFMSLYDVAMLGICSNSKIPLRVMTLVGFLSSFVSFLFGMFYLTYKLINWNSFRIGMAPVIIGLFFLGSIQLIFLGIIGEYIGFIFTNVQRRPLVIEEKRINF